MKQLQLNLQKRILIVEAELEFEPKEGTEYYVPEDAEELFILPKGNFKLICKGSELSEEIAKGLVQSPDNFQFLDAENTFIGEIEKKGCYWDNKKVHSINSQQEFDELWASFEDWDNIQSKKFNPEKTLIFEIL